MDGAPAMKAAGLHIADRGLAVLPVMMAAWVSWGVSVWAQDLPPVPLVKPPAPNEEIIITSAIPEDDLLVGEGIGADAVLPIPPAKPEIPKDALFTVLSDEDVTRYRQIFSAQQLADWETADRLIAALSDPILLGHVLAQRYLHPTGWRSSYAELSAWLLKYADHPDAERIHRLALSRQPEGAAAPQAPQAGRLDYVEYVGEELQPASDEVDEASWDHLSSGQRGTLRDIVAQVRRHVRAGENLAARRALADATFLALADDLTQDRMAAEVARGYFVGGDDDNARQLAEPALERSGSKATLAGWIAGLAAYRQNDLDAARHAFEILSAGNPDEDLVAAGAYWAARINLLVGEPSKVATYLNTALARPYSFYGLLAQHALGNEIELNERLPVLSDAERSSLAVLPEVRRAIALAQVGQHHRADQEFDAVNAYDRPGLAVAMLRLAVDLHLPAAQYRLARELLYGYSERFDAALYPLPDWRPKNGFDLDPALMFAVMRRESEFRAFSSSDAGAQGPMQIMPSTAAYISGDDSFTGSRKHLLNDPMVALQLGQEYFAYLLDLDNVNGNLFFALAAYNGGPGNLSKWLETTGATYDPLLFIETIPSRETRFFIERVMANYWIYRLRLNEPVTTLDMVAAGQWPLYQGEERYVAGN
jgi:soluble lytic murein transglycosylase